MRRRISAYIVAVLCAVSFSLLFQPLTGLTSASSLANSVAQSSGSGCQTFPQTDKTVCGRFLQYWQDHGGVAQQGYPISNSIGEVSSSDGKLYTVQYFERAVIESHPENQPPNDVLGQLLGSFQYTRQYANAAPNQTANTSAGSTLFPQTGKHIGGGFLTYWQQHGGLQQQGYPISEELQEKSDLNGQTYTVQYFQRAEFEFHPENPPATRILLSQLGTFRYSSQYGTGPTPSKAQLAPPQQVPPAIATPSPVPAPPTPRPAPAAPAATPRPIIQAPTPKPQPTKAPQPSGKYVATASVSDDAPSMNEHVTVTGRLLRGGQPVPGATMDTSWHYKTTTSGCTSATDASGTASCSRSISHATPGYTVEIDVVFTTVDGQVVETSTSFTPNY